MLNTFRENAQGIIMWIIIGLIILAMAGFVLPSYFSGGAAQTLASVNGIQIQPRELNQAVQQRKDMLRKQFGEYFNSDLISDDLLREQELKRLVNRELFTQLVSDQNVQVSDKQIITQLQSFKEFRDENGNFNPQVYKNMLKTQGMSQPGFEQKVAQDVATKNFFNGIFNTTFITGKQAELYNKLQAQQREATLITFHFDKYPLDKNIDNARIEDYYNKNKNRFMTDAQVAVQYLELSLDKLAEKFDITHQEIAQQYDEHIGNYTEQDFTTALRLATDLKRRLDKGEDFAAMAKKYSQDTVSAKNGGDLGFISKGMMLKPFEEAVYGMKLGEISQPVKTEYGYHIIKLVKIDKNKRQVSHILIPPPQKAKSLDSVKEMIRKELQLRKAEETFYEDVDKLQNITYETTDTLEPAASATGLKPVVTERFTRNTAKGLLKTPAVLNAIFTDEVLTQGKNSDVIQLSDTHYVVLRVKEYVAPSLKPLNDVKQEIIAAVANEKRNELANSNIVAAVSDLKSGNTLAAVKGKYKYITVEKLGFVSRNAKVADDKKKAAKDKVADEVRRKLFTMDIPAQENQSSVDTVKLRNGNEGIILFTATRQDPEFNSTDSAANRLAARKLNSIYSEAEFNAFENLLYKQADVVMNLPNQTDQQ